MANPFQRGREFSCSLSPVPHWQAAVEALIMAAEGSPAWLMMARIAMLKAMNHGHERVFLLRSQRDALG
jgi:hypothetical protein